MSSKATTPCTQAATICTQARAKAEAEAEAVERTKRRSRAQAELKAAARVAEAGVAEAVAVAVASPMVSRASFKEVVGMAPQVIGELKQAQAAMREAASTAGVSVATRVSEAEEAEEEEEEEEEEDGGKRRRGTSAGARWQQAGGVVAAVSQAARLRTELEAANQTIRQLETRAETAEARPIRRRPSPNPNPTPNPTLTLTPNLTRRE